MDQTIQTIPIRAVTVMVLYLSNMAMVQWLPSILAPENDDFHSIDSPIRMPPHGWPGLVIQKMCFQTFFGDSKIHFNIFNLSGQSDIPYSLPLHVFQWVYFDLEQSTSFCCCRWLPVCFFVINPNLV